VSMRVSTELGIPASPAMSDLVRFRKNNSDTPLLNHLTNTGMAVDAGIVHDDKRLLCWKWASLSKETLEEINKQLGSV
jgi:hypothetical protein